MEITTVKRKWLQGGKLQFPFTIHFNICFRIESAYFMRVQYSFVTKYRFNCEDLGSINARKSTVQIKSMHYSFFGRSMKKIDLSVSNVIQVVKYGIRRNCFDLHWNKKMWIKKEKKTRKIINDKKIWGEKKSRIWRRKSSIWRKKSLIMQEKKTPQLVGKSLNFVNNLYVKQYHIHSSDAA